MSKQLYGQRFKKHLKDAKDHLAKGDYVQAGEKIWGALSALVNSRAPLECKRPNDKERFFVPILRKHLQANPGVRKRMQQLGWRTERELFHTVFGWHKFFYGGASYPAQQLSGLMPFLTQLLENL